MGITFIRKTYPPQEETCAGITRIKKIPPCRSIRGCTRYPTARSRSWLTSPKDRTWKACRRLLFPRYRMIQRQNGLYSLEQLQLVPKPTIRLLYPKLLLWEEKLLWLWSWIYGHWCISRATNLENKGAKKTQMSLISMVICNKSKRWNISDDVTIRPGDING